MWHKKNICNGCGVLVLEWPYSRCPKCKQKDDVSMGDQVLSSRIEFIRESKNKPCTDCHISYPYYVMDFDHLPQYEKSFEIGRSFVSGRSMEQIKKEIAKCELVCANCHRIRTHKREVEAKILKEAELPIL